MRFDPGLQIGDKLTFKALRTKFQCGNMGGILPSRKNKAIVIISSHVKGIYGDKWDGDILHYTGAGQEGDQALKGNNKALLESNENGYTVYLFEEIVKKEYIYRGIVQLVDRPYMEEQPDKNGKMRKVWMFPVKLQKDLEVEELEADEKLLDILDNLSTEDIEKTQFEYTLTPQEKDEAVIRNHIKIWPRKATISANALIYARFQCEIDRAHPSFIRKRNNQNYVEPHHLVPMKYSDEFDVSLDVEENIVSLCSNCHKEIHYGRDYEKLLEILYEKRKKLLEQVGIYVTLERLKEMYL